MYLESAVLGLEAKYPEARALLERVNQESPMNSMVIRQLVQVCEQIRDYSAAGAYLRVALRLSSNDETLQKKKELYEKMGIL